MLTCSEQKLACNVNGTFLFEGTLISLRHPVFWCKLFSYNVKNWEINQARPSTFILYLSLKQAILQTLHYSSAEFIPQILKERQREEINKNLKQTGSHLKPRLQREFCRKALLFSPCPMSIAKQTDVSHHSLVAPDTETGTAIIPGNSSKQTLWFVFCLTFLKSSLFSSW